MNQTLNNLSVDALDVTVSVATIPNSGKMELAYCYAENTLHTGYLDTAGIFHDLSSPIGLNNVLSVGVTVTIKIKDSVVSAGYATDRTDSSIRVPLKDLVTGINTQKWDLTASATTLTSYAVATAWASATDYYYDSNGTMTKDTTVTSANFAEKNASHQLYTKTEDVADESRARFYLDGELTTTRDTATSLAVASNFGLSFVYNATPASATYSTTKSFNVYVYGGDHTAATVYDADVKDLINGFSVGLAVH